MAKKRKSESTGLDEVERTLYKSFCSAANSISQLYTQAQHQQKFAFQAGERHCVEKLYQWLQRDYEAGSNISVEEILNYLQNQIDNEETTMSPVPQFHHLSTQQQQPLQHHQQQHHQQHQQQHQHQQSIGPNNQSALGAVGYSLLGNSGRMGAAVDPTKASVFTGALSSPNRRQLPPFPVVPGGYVAVTGGRRSAGGVDLPVELQEEPESPASTQSQVHSVTPLYGYNPSQGQHREPSTFVENDFSMDMHADGGSDQYY